MAMGQKTPAGVLCTGNIVFDMLVHPVDQLRWGATTWVETIGQSMGGNGANTSYTLACLGVPVRLIAVVGEDTFGEELLSGLRAAGVDTSSVTRSRGATPTTIALVRSDGNRLFLHKPGVSLQAISEPIEFTALLMHGMTHFHVANPFSMPAFRKHVAETLRRASTAGLTTSLDAAWDSQGRWIQDLGPCLPHVGTLFVNEEEGALLAGVEDPLEAGRVLRRMGAGTVVVKLGSRGCFVVSEREEFRVPAFDVEVLDTTGAGDCFAGGYLAAIQRGFPPREAARFANAAGALSVRRVGAVGGLLSWDDMQEWMRTAKVRDAA
jgi:sugar/nucleoside kinase (ribokinase family)